MEPGNHYGSKVNRWILSEGILFIFCFDSLKKNILNAPPPFFSNVPLSTMRDHIVWDLKCTYRKLKTHGSHNLLIHRVTPEGECQQFSWICNNQQTTSEVRLPMVKHGWTSDLLATISILINCEMPVFYGKIHCLLVTITKYTVNELNVYIYTCIYNHMYMYMYMHIYIYMYMYMSMYMYMYMYIYMYMQMHIHMQTYVYANVCVYVQVYNHIYIYMYKYYVYVYVNVNVYVYNHMYIYIYVYLNMCAYIGVYIYMYMYGWIDGWMYGCMDVWMYGCMDIWMYGCMYGCMDVWMYGCMDVCMYVFMYVCMYVKHFWHIIKVQQCCWLMTPNV